MTFKEYQKLARQTVVYPRVGDLGWVYPVIGLSSEVGEVADKLKKVIRDKDGKMDDETKQAIAKELGDVLWYVTQLGSELGLELEDIATGNIAKLTSRHDRDQISGSGDER